MELKDSITNSITPNSSVKIKRYNLKQLAQLYECDRKTMWRWLKPFRPLIGKRIGYSFSAEQIAIIFKKLGLPF